MVKATSDSAPSARPSEPGGEIQLKDPGLAALLTWLIPGLGQWYQGRRFKAALFFICIVSTFSYGLFLGKGRVVYASLREHDRRLPYFCQAGVGLPALVALVQARRFQGRAGEDLRIDAAERLRKGQSSVSDWFMVPPQVADENSADELGQVQKELGRFWELGTVFTMVAGLLNVLAIYDAWGGPAYTDAEQPAKKDDDVPLPDDEDETAPS